MVSGLTSLAQRILPAMIEEMGEAQPLLDHGVSDRVESLLEARTEANRQFFAAESERLAQLCHRMAERFSRGGRLVALGTSPAARSDVRHVTVEFVHPVIVGKRALPAIGLSREGGPLPQQIRLTTEPDDIAIAFDPTGAEWEFQVPSDDSYIRQELVETFYHVLWELVHVFFEHRGLLEGRQAGSVHDSGASSFLYPFLSESETDLDAVLADVRASALMKSEEAATLRRQTLLDARVDLAEAAAALRACFESGGKLLALGNGGSATDAMDLVADLRHPDRADWAPHAAIDLTEDTAIITAVGNDVGIDVIFQRQVIAYGREGDALVAISTSGNSTNVIEALAEARRRGLLTVALVGYDGGRIATESLADHAIVTRSQHIPRIQEAQASAYHALRELIETAPQ